jgi:hypothetical protein
MNPITFSFSTLIVDTGLVVLGRQDSLKGILIDGLNIINCKAKSFDIGIYLIQDSTKRRPPSINFEDIKDYYEKIFGAINATASFTLDTVKMNFSKIFDLDKDWKLDKDTESRLLNSHNVDGSPGYKVYIIDLEITRPDLADNEFIGGLAFRNLNFPMINSMPIAIVTTYQNNTVSSSVSHELGHLIFGLNDVFIDPNVPGFTTYKDEFNLMDYVKSAGSYIYDDRKLRAYQVLEIENKIP